MEAKRWILDTMFLPQASNTARLPKGVCTFDWFADRLRHCRRPANLILALTWHQSQQQKQDCWATPMPISHQMQRSVKLQYEDQYRVMSSPLIESIAAVNTRGQQTGSVWRWKWRLKCSEWGNGKEGRAMAITLQLPQWVKSITEAKKMMMIGHKKDRSVSCVREFAKQER